MVALSLVLSLELPKLVLRVETAVVVVAAEASQLFPHSED